jgi:hypothetical protein
MGIRVFPSAVQKVDRISHRRFACDFFEFAPRNFVAPKRSKPNDLKFSVWYDLMPPARASSLGTGKKVIKVGVLAAKYVQENVWSCELKAD